MAIGLVIAWAVGGEQVAQPGEPAPDFTVELLEGGSFTLSDHLAADARPLVVNLWASWCAPCREEIPALSAFAEANPEIAVLGVAVEDRPEESVELAESLEPSYQLAHGNPGFESSYPNLGLPVTYFIDGSGTVTEVFNGILTLDTLNEKMG